MDAAGSKYNAYGKGESGKVGLGSPARELGARARLVGYETRASALLYARGEGTNRKTCVRTAARPTLMVSIAYLRWVGGVFTAVSTGWCRVTLTMLKRRRSGRS